MKTIDDPSALLESFDILGQGLSPHVVFMPKPCTLFLCGLAEERRAGMEFRNIQQ